MSSAPPRLDSAELEACLTPSGRILLVGEGCGELEEAFAESNAAGLLCLGCGQRGELSPSLAFWRRFAERFIGAACAALDPTKPAGWIHPSAGPEALAELAAATPPMRGSEYVSAKVLAALWHELDAHLERLAAANENGLTGLLEARDSNWHVAGRVCLHLAENKNNPELPFAFIATYARRIPKRKELQYVPLDHALREYHGAGEKERLVALLTPLQRASESCPWIDELVRSGDIYHPLAWTADQAYALLSDVEALEAAGLVVRLPDWWKRGASARPTVSVTVGEDAPAGIGLAAMLDFQVRVTLGGQELSDEELSELLRSSAGLALIRGRWIEAKPEQLSAVLDQWFELKGLVEEDGLGFGKAMRLLAGTAPELGAKGDWALTPEWSKVSAGRWLDGQLDALREPVLLKAIDEHAGLDAELRPYQKHGVQWLFTLFELQLGGCLADDMGLGKTIQVIGLLSLLLKRNRKARSKTVDLLIVPASLVANWAEELARFAPQLKPLIAHASAMPSRELKQLPAATVAAADLVITTYGTVARTPWMAEYSWRMIVLDEAQAIKNPNAKQTRTIKKLRSSWRLALTGTPVENRLGDLWSIFDFLNPGLLGSAKAFGDFCRQSARVAGGGGDGYGPLRKLVQPYILRRLKTDKRVISDLPDKTEVTAHCLLTKLQAALYKESVHELEVALDEARDGEAIQRRGIVLAYLMRFKQICNHPSLWLGTPEFAPEASGKLQRLAELVEPISARQEKLLVFTQFRSMTGALSRHLETCFGRPGLVLHGGTRIKRRQEMVHEFQADDGPSFMVLSLKAGGTGLNLTAANHVIHFDRWWNPAVERQATDRAFRIGQKRNVMVHKFVCQGTIEERINALIASKEVLAESVLQTGAESNLTELSNDELLSMVRLDLGSAVAS
jgi:superfamily II DNA or RNA helicase